MSKKDAKMVAEPWILKMGHQVSTNLKNALYLENSSKTNNTQLKVKETIGILSFEVANVMSKIIHLHKSLSDNEMFKLTNEIFKCGGIVTLVSSDEKKLLELALVEKIDDLNRVASVVSRLGRKCTVPALQGFEHVYSDIVSGRIDVLELGFLVKDMDAMVRRMERYVNSTASLYNEMEVMNELEIATKKFQQNHHEESRKAYEQKLLWQKQDVRHLRNVSLWNQTYDKVVELLARTLCTIYARVYVVFRDMRSDGDVSATGSSQVSSGRSTRSAKKKSSLTKSMSIKSNGHCHSGPMGRKGLENKKTGSFNMKTGLQRAEGGMLGPDDFNFACGIGPGRMFMECLSLSTSGSKVEDGNDDDRVTIDDQSSQISGCFSVASGLRREHPALSGCFMHAINGDPFGGDQSQLHNSSPNGSRFGPRSRLLVYAHPNSIGGSALALHYANVIIVIEKLLRYPHLVGDEARDDLYQMLPTSLRKTLKISLKSYVKDVAIYDAPLAHDWKERLDSMLKWLAPLAHNMIRWQSERNFEQQQIVTKTNVLLLQTLYFADREKTEAAICEILVGLNYICRYEQQHNALLDCASSFDFEDCMEWQSQFSGPFRN